VKDLAPEICGVLLAQICHFASQIEQIADLHHFAMSRAKGFKE
jgi:hypothetical protein